MTSITLVYKGSISVEHNSDTQGRLASRFGRAYVQVVRFRGPSRDEDSGVTLPIMISGTITDLSGRTLSGQTTTAFWYSMRHLKPFAIGLNCALGAEAMRPYIAELSAVADTLVSAYPNAGLPNAMGEYDETPHEMACQIEPWAKDGLVNIVGCCCGSTPDHIAHVRRHVEKHPPRKPPKIAPRMRLSGLEPFVAG